MRLFAPFIPFVTDEVWSWWQAGSVHGQPWPARDSTPAIGNVEMLDPVSEVLAAIRRTKTEAKVSQKAQVALLVIAAPADTQELLAAAEGDLRDAGSIESVRFEAGYALTCAVELAPVPDAQ